MADTRACATIAPSSEYSILDEPDRIKREQIEKKQSRMKRLYDQGIRLKRFTVAEMPLHQFKLQLQADECCMGGGSMVMMGYAHTGKSTEMPSRSVMSRPSYDPNSFAWLEHINEQTSSS